MHFAIGDWCAGAARARVISAAAVLLLVGTSMVSCLNQGANVIVGPDGCAAEGPFLQGSITQSSTLPSSNPRNQVVSVPSDTWYVASGDMMQASATQWSWGCNAADVTKSMCCTAAVNTPTTLATFACRSAATTPDGTCQDGPVITHPAGVLPGARLDKFPGGMAAADNRQAEREFGPDFLDSLVDPAGLNPTHPYHFAVGPSDATFRLVPVVNSFGHLDDGLPTDTVQTKVVSISGRDFSPIAEEVDPSHVDPSHADYQFQEVLSGAKLGDNFSPHLRITQIHATVATTSADTPEERSPLAFCGVRVEIGTGETRYCGSVCERFTDTNSPGSCIASRVNLDTCTALNPTPSGRTFSPAFERGSPQLNSNGTPLPAISWRVRLKDGNGPADCQYPEPKSLLQPKNGPVHIVFTLQVAP